MQEVVIIGAGKIGRGYMAQIFYENNYQVTFVDLLPELIQALNQAGEYRIHEVDTDIHEVYKIRGIKAFHADAVDQICKQLSKVSIVITSVGAGNLPAVAQNIAAAIQYRIKENITSYLNIILAENLMNGAMKFKDMVKSHLTSEEIAFMDATIGIVGSVIGRTVPPPPPSYKNFSVVDVVVEPHREFYINKFDLKGKVLEIEGVHVIEHFDAAVCRKLYVHNCTHAVLGYLGHYYGYSYSHEAMADDRVSSVVWQAMVETALAVEKEFGFSHEDMQAYINNLFHRYHNAELWDTLERIARDPIRKLQPDDRLIGAARLIEKTGEVPEALTIGIAAALCFQVESDEKSKALQQQIQKMGVEAVLEQTTGVATTERLANDVLAQYHRLRQR